MGQAKIREARLKAALCRCLSGKPAKHCCYVGKWWHKAAAMLGLRNLPANATNRKCYMSELGSCEGPISGEHLVSEGVIRFIEDGGQFLLSGAPWLDEGQSKVFAPGNLTANCLCRKHNSALSPLDTAALRFFQMLRPCWVNQAAPLHYLISGHDLERWMLKTLKALAVSKNLAKGRERLSGVFQEAVGLIDMLDSPAHWPELTGVYCIMQHGTRTENRNHFQLAPLYGQDNDIIGGMTANLLGIDFLLMIEPPDMAKSTLLQRSVYRPGSIEVTIGNIINRIDISWDDKRSHSPVGLTYAGPAPLP